MGSLLDKLLTLVIPALILAHLLCAPYTKVEESFNLQATHDILAYGIPTRDINESLRAEYDHFTFPGAVPRTFTGALVLATFSKVWSGYGIGRQIVVRGVLGLFNSVALLLYRKSLSAAFGSSAGNWFVLFQAGQFHVVYYASRTLPNIFAFALTTMALGYLLPSPSTLANRAADKKRCRLAIYSLAFAGVVFRSEVAILLATHVGWLWLQRRVSLRDVIWAGSTGSLVGLLVTVSVDSFFWQRPVWPELAGFYYNAIEGNSVAWGTNPWHYYFTNALPRLLMNPLSWQLCMPLALGLKATRRRSLDILFPLVAFVGIYSFQPHKEWRFILYTIPGLTGVAAIGADWIWNRRAKSIIYRFLSLCLIGSVFASILANAGFLAISRLNYPGAVALNRLHEIADGSEKVVRVHMDTLSCTSGVTRFLQMAPPLSAIRPGSTLWQYDKTEDPGTLLTPMFWNDFDYVLAEKPERVIGNWELVDEIDGFAGIGIARVDDDLKSRQDQTASHSRPGLQRWLEEIYLLVPAPVRTNVLGGRWIQIKMEPAIRILKSQPGSPPPAAPDT